VDRRLHPATTRLAHSSLAGQISLPLTDGTATLVSVPLADLLDGPSGARERQLILGEAFHVIDRDLGFAFGFAQKDGYCGWLKENELTPMTPDIVPSHWVATPGTHLYGGPKVQHWELAALCLGARVRVIDQAGDWAQTLHGFVPARHLLPIGMHLVDVVGVAEALAGTPYLWGGNSRAGCDCSGLVQMAHLACGIPCPSDSDLQENLGKEVSETDPAQRGDLLFWRGHVALVVDRDRLIHANAHSMSVAYERIHDCILRIAEQGGGAVTHRRRL
jgi:hypothetical protein